jgi:hypothetical protein
MPLRRQLIQTTLTCLAALAFAAGAAAPAHAAKDLESMFQDDNQLIYNTPAGAASAMDTLKQLGVDRIRLSIIWKAIAPQALSDVRPDFNAADPAAYSPAVWANYDRIVRLARERGIAVNFNVTAPAPLWATGNPGDRPDLKDVFAPDANQFGLFVHALGVRYSGAYSADGSLLPRVRYWSIWNEPNQGAWLAPQSAIDLRNPGKKAMVETSPVVYRGLVDAAWKALHETGHGDDTILIGETAPQGRVKNGKQELGVSFALDPLRFIRQLYCLDDNLQLYKGSSAQIRFCPIGPNALTDFVTQHPALFQATGYAHHPYSMTRPPSLAFPNKDWATIANLGNLSKQLRKIYQRYRQVIPDKKKDVPLYLTEFGYQTNPPDSAGFSLSRQAAYNNESEYIAWKNPTARTLSQFLLLDDKPKPSKIDPKGYGNSFQTGLETDKGKKKPSYAAYAMGIYLPSRRATSKKKLKVWGVARVAPDSTVQTVTVEARGKKGTKYKKIGSLKTDGKRGYVYGNVKVSRDGAVRLTWKSTAGVTYHSRAIAFSVKKKK